MHDLIYGEKHFRIAENKDAALARFNRHNQEVRDYFKDRSHDLLDWDLTSEPDWEKLCAFLKVSVPRRAFPHGKRQA